MKKIFFIVLLLVSSICVAQNNPSQIVVTDPTHTINPKDFEIVHSPYTQPDTLPLFPWYNDKVLPLFTPDSSQMRYPDPHLEVKFDFENRQYSLTGKRGSTFSIDIMFVDRCEQTNGIERTLYVNNLIVQYNKDWTIRSVTYRYIEPVELNRVTTVVEAGNCEYPIYVTVDIHPPKPGKW